MNSLKYLFFFLISFLSYSTLNAQVSVRASIDSSSIRIGQQAVVRLSVVSPHGESFVFPNIKPGDTLREAIEVLNVTPIDSSSSGNENRWSQDLLITSFVVGEHVIPPFFLNSSSGNRYQSNELVLEVKDVAEPIKEGEFKDIKKNYWSPLGYFYLLLILGIIAGLALIFFIAKYYYDKKKYSSNGDIRVNIEPEIKLLPHEKALKELEAIKNDKIWKNGQDKMYHTQITDVIREYLSARFGIPTFEKTSSEILELLKYKIDAQPILDNLNQIFSVSDMVKFAKLQPTPEENEMSLVNAFVVVNNTIINPVNEKKVAVEETNKVNVDE